MTDKETPIFGDTIFCDDIRFEVGNKASLIGVYNGVMFFADGQPFPIMLPKLCMSVRIYMPFDTNPDRIELSVYFPGNADDAPDYKQSIENLPPVRKLLEDVDVVDLRSVFVTPLIFSPLELAATGAIKVRANVKGETVKLGALFIRTQPVTTIPVG
jgi:hypothetical protein